ncbi:N,N-dimethylformamidase beta subunit family domain-containing protein [Alphaproteobacteria bacterium LSUCC0684]
MKDVFIAGYSDRLSARPGETIRFSVSSHATSSFSASLHRSICADPNPEGPGIIEEDASAYFPQASFPSRVQPIHPGSCAETTTSLDVKASSEFEVNFWFMPGVITGGNQIMFAWGGLSIFLKKDGRVAAEFAHNLLVTSASAVRKRRWYKCTLHLTKEGTVTLTLASKAESKGQEETRTGETSSGKMEKPVFSALSGQRAPLRIAAGFGEARQHFNGKIEAPQILADGEIAAAWDFSVNIPSLIVKATRGPDLILYNAPTRGVTGRKWDASEFCWKHKPEHYAAIHFHDDDIYDFNWECDFEFTIPADMPSGIYVMRIEAEDHYDAMPFFVCPPLGKPGSDLCLLVSTFTYTVYGNHARPDFNPTWIERINKWKAYPHNPAEHPDYGLSTYNTHRDGSGICHASHKRVLFNLRPGYSTFGESTCSGLRHFQADSHLVAWLHHQGITYDIITDDELDRDGLTAISSYKTVMTGSHPEYHTASMIDALKEYRDDGGRLIYLGGNGFYWRIVRHSEDPSLIEIRRSEDGLRAWAAEPGEYYNAFDGSYGGLWRRNGRPPQQLVGIGFTAQGNFVGMPYKRTCFDPEFDWVFDGIETDTLGDFGFSGHGAAGFELDRVDENLDEGENITVLAQSFDRDKRFILVPEEVLTHLTNLSGGPEDEVRRADMVYFKTASGGEVFGVGSITFCGSLPWNNFENNISTLLANVIRKFRSG